MKINILPSKSGFFCIFLLPPQSLDKLFLSQTALQKILYLLRNFFIIQLFVEFFHIHFVKTFYTTSISGSGSNQKLKEHTGNSIYIAFISMLLIFGLLRRTVTWSQRRWILFFTEFFFCWSKIAEFEFTVLS